MYSKIIKYKFCPVCGSKLNKYLKNINSISSNNFYVKSIIKDFKLNQKDSKKFRIKECLNCKSIYHSNWFDNISSNNIFNVVYGQHHYGWNRYYKNTKTNSKKTNKILNKDLYNLFFKKNKNIKYAEFNCPFSGLFLEIFNNEYDMQVNFKKLFHKKIVQYFENRQVANTNNYKEKYPESLSDIDTIKNQFISNRKIVEKYLLVDNSSLCWGQNCVSESVNCRSFSQILFDFKTINLNEVDIKKYRFDLFGIFLTLDHTLLPNKIINLAINSSKNVIIHSHINTDISHQHLFSLTKDFIHYLKRKKLYVVDLSKILFREKYENIKDNEMIILCSKERSLIDKIKIN